MNEKNYNNILINNAEKYSDKRLFRFLLKDEQWKDITYSELDSRAKARAVYLKNFFAKGDRVLLGYAPGIEYITTFWACLYAGLIAVPAYVPNKINLRVLSKILINANVRGIICEDENFVQMLKTLFKTYNLDEWLNNIQLLSTENIDLKMENEWIPEDIKLDDIAFLQYTSGSTGSPKGVMVTHSNLLPNSSCIKKYFSINDECHIVSWLPPFHDMGLIGMILQTIYAGASSTLMAPVTFVKKPARWLNAIYRGSLEGDVISGGPNFSYDLCVRRVKDEDLLPDLSLKGWRTVFSGAEPVLKSTLDRFYNRFKTYGFEYNNFFPVYGLAEGTLLASTGVNGQPIIRFFDCDHIENNHIAIERKPEKGKRIKSYVACGTVMENGHELKIVDSKTFNICEEKHIGEIWLKGGSITQGYWNNEEATENIYNAYTTTGEGPFMRTGDLGFTLDGQLYITGRLKDMIIINGKNHYPQDIEMTVSNAHQALRRNNGVAFSVDIDSAESEKLVILQEIEKNHINNFPKQEIVSSITKNLSEHHQLNAHSILLMPPMSIAKTTSGKLMRQTMKKLFSRNKLVPLHQWNTEQVH